MRRPGFTNAQREAIGKKVEQLIRIKKGILSPQELAAFTGRKRVGWLKKNLKRLLKKYAHLDDLEKAFVILCFEYLKIDPRKQKLTRISPTKLRIDSYNFCPYLEACKLIGLDTRFICKEVLESSTQAALEVINPKIKFSRNYENMRPHNPDYCEEYLELLED